MQLFVTIFIGKLFFCGVFMKKILLFLTVFLSQSFLLSTSPFDFFKDPMVVLLEKIQNLFKPKKDMQLLSMSLASTSGTEQLDIGDLTEKIVTDFVRKGCKPCLTRRLKRMFSQEDIEYVEDVVELKKQINNSVIRIPELETIVRTDNNLDGIFKKFAELEAKTPVYTKEIASCRIKFLNMILLVVEQSPVNVKK
jgi:hypothetical protein